MHRIHKATGKFVPYEFLRSVGRESITDVQLGDHTEKEVTVFFSDIRDFTQLAEKLTPTQNFEFVNQYVGEMGPIIRQHSGFVNQYFGDGIMAIFPRESDQALSAAIDMQKRITHLNEHILSDRPIQVGMGLHTGSLVMGIIGDQDRNEPATIADAVNAASRMEGLTKHYGANIIISEACYHQIQNKDQFHVRYIGPVQVKGKEQSMGIYECFDGDDSISRQLKMESSESFRDGLNLFFQKEFGEASVIFGRIVKQNNQDFIAEYFRKKAALYSFQGAPVDWDGIEKLDTK